MYRINEAAGVLPGVYEESVKLFHNLISELKNKQTSDIIDNQLMLDMRSNIPYQILGREMANSQILIIISDDNGYEFLGINKFQAFIKRDYNPKVAGFERSPKPELIIKIHLSHDPRTGDLKIIDIIDFIVDNDKLIITSLSHELSHVAHEQILKPLTSINNMAKYSLVANSDTNQDYGTASIYHFLSLIYYTNSIETLVVSTEFWANIKESEVTKATFVDYLLGHEIYTTFKMGSEITYERLRETLRRELERVIPIVQTVREGRDLPETLDEYIDDYLEMTYTILAGNILDRFAGVNGEHFLILTKALNVPIEMFLSEAESMMYRRLKKSLKLNKSYEDFYKSEINGIVNTSKKMMKKLAKLHSLLDK